MEVDVHAWTCLAGSGVFSGGVSGISTLAWGYIDARGGYEARRGGGGIGIWPDSAMAVAKRQSAVTVERRRWI